MRIKNYLLFLFVLVFFSCSQDDDIIEEQQSAEQPIEQAAGPLSGVVLTFDDDYVDEWYEANKLLQPYNWKATFFVTKFNQLSQSKIKELKDLKSQGHEIGAHGVNHINAPNYISANGTAAYMNDEIFPMLDAMRENNLAPTSFAYPYGARNTSTDNLLLSEFQIIRGTTYDMINPAYQNCYFNNNRLVFGLGIDNNYSHFSVSYFLSLLEYAKYNNKIVIFYAHKPVSTVKNNYETEFQTLIEICNYVKQNKMKFYKISELYTQLKTTT